MTNSKPYLIVGDVHATPQELGDCEALWGLVKGTLAEHPEISRVILLGDQYNTHDILNTRVVDFWNRSLGALADKALIALVGNHDQLTPTIRFPHSMICHEYVFVVGVPGQVDASCVAMPYYHDPKEFVKEAQDLREKYPEAEVLFCHQTFVGADKEMGFYGKDAVDQGQVPFRLIISGHIHKPMKIGKVWYPGSPRWRTKSDAEVEKRAIWIWTPGSPPIPVLTNGVCTRVYDLTDSQDQLVDSKLEGVDLTKADIRIAVSGTSDYIAKRITELKAKYGAKCRGVPVRSRLVRTSESEGVERAFARFGHSFNPPHGTDNDLLVKEAHARLS